MSDLKPCPFCGGAVSECDESPLFGGSIMHGETECLFKNNLLFNENIAERWNSRPIEDALRSRIAELEKSAIVWHRYPEEKPVNGRYYITYNGKNVEAHFWRGGAEYWADMASSEDDIIINKVHDITHWAYLPAPPKEVLND